MKKNIVKNVIYAVINLIKGLVVKTYAAPLPSIPGSPRANYAFKKTLICSVYMLIINMFFSNMLMGQGGLNPGDRIGDLIILKAYSPPEMDTTVVNYYWIFTRVSQKEGFDPATGKYEKNKSERRDVDVAYQRLPDDQEGNEVWLFNLTNYNGLYAYPKTYITVGDYVEHKYWATEMPIVNPKEDDVAYVIFIRYRLYDDGQVADSPYWFSLLQWPDRETCFVLSN